MCSALPVVWSRLHALHDPADREALIESALHRAAGDTSDFALGEAETWMENPRRVDALLARLRGHGRMAVTEARHHSLEEGVLLVHDDAFVSWLRQFWAVWKAAGQPGRFGDGETGLLPDTFRYSCCCCAKPASPPPTGTATGGGASVDV
jgi:acetoin utilization deacetylase AcuC-like enzyme